jgi:hypothetical protein
VLVCDEFGYISFDTNAVVLFYQLVSGPYVMVSIIVPSNLHFSSWSEISGNATAASATSTSQASIAPYTNSRASVQSARATPLLRLWRRTSISPLPNSLNEFVLQRYFFRRSVRLEMGIL